MARLAAGITCILIFVVLAWHWPATSAPAVTQPPVDAHASSATVGYMGVGSCASSACHGGPHDSPRSWQRSYSTWSTEDQHSRAYRVLFEDRAKRIVQLLDNLPELERARPSTDTRCLGCHTTVDPAVPQTHNLLADGVGCEACHGPARRWLVDHTTWPAANLRALAQSHDMKYTKDVRVLAGVCVGCHVGDSVSRDMNHDMLAAGHPRLDFEFSAYLANLPRHWHARTDEAQAWAAGQAVTAQAALRLLADRADQANALISQEKAPSWPEFSEYDCFRCHHDLRGGDSGQRLLLSIPAAQRHALGGYLWGSWYFTLPRLLADQQKNQAFESQLATLARIMSQPLPDPQAAGNGARQLAATLEPITAALHNADSDPKWIERTLILVASNRSILTWDQAAQSYLACAALNNERLSKSRAARSPVDVEIDRQLVRLREELRFGRSGKLRFDSPRDYDPQAVQAEFRRLQDLFEKLGQ